MSLFNVNYRNEIDIRSNNAYSEKLFTVNPLNGLMERVLPGGGGGGGGDPYVPFYWIQPQSANIYDNSSRDATTHTKLGFTVENIADDKKSSLTKDGIEVDNNAAGTGSFLTSTALTFGDSIDNASFTKVGAKNLAEIGARITKTTPTATDKILIYDMASSAYRTTDWRDYLKPTSVLFSTASGYSQVSPTDVICSVPLVNGGALCLINKSGLSIGTKVSGSNTFDTSYGRVNISGTSVTSYGNSANQFVALTGSNVFFYQGGISRQLTFDILGDLINLYTKTSATSPESGDNMLLFDATSNIYKYCPVPAGVSVPTYIKPSSIEMTNTTGNKVQVKTGPTPNEYIELNTSGLSMRAGENNEVTMTRDTLADLVKFKARTFKAAPTEDDKVITYNPSTYTFNMTNRDTSRVLTWVPVLTGNQTKLYDNNGLVDGTKLTYSNRTLTSTTPYDQFSSVFRCPVIGTGLVEMKNGDILHMDFPDDAAKFGFTLTNTNRIAVLPFKILGGSYSSFSAFPMWNVLFDVNFDVTVTVEPGTYYYQGPSGETSVNCNLLVFNYTGTTSQTVIPDVTLQLVRTSLAGATPIGNSYE